MAIRNRDKEIGISWAIFNKQILIRNRTKRIRKGSIPTVKLLFCIPDIHTVDLCPTILVALTSFMWKARAALWSLFLLSKGKRAVPMSPLWRTQAHTQPHRQHIHHAINSSLLSKEWRRRKRSQAGDTATEEATRCNEQPYSDDPFKSGYKTPVIRSLHLSSRMYLWWIWHLWGLTGKICATLRAAAATTKSLHCCLILATKNYKNPCNKCSCS